MKIILFGSTGMLGSYVLNILRNKYDILCINKHIFDIETANWEKLHMLINRYLVKDDIIINCAGIIPQKVENNILNLNTYICVNTLFPHKLSEISNMLNIKFIHITTDCVYSGLKGDYFKNDKHDSTTLYGITKSLGEPYNSTVIRTSIIGEELTGKKSLLEWVKSNKNGEINGYVNHYWNGVTCLTLAKVINEIIDNNLFWKGVKHICSPNSINKFELCSYINIIYELNINIKESKTYQEKNMTLNNNNEDTYNFHIDSIYKQIKDLKEFNLIN